MVTACTWCLALTEPRPRLRLDFHGHCPPDAWPSPYWTAPQVKAGKPDAWPSPYWTTPQVKAGLPWSLPCTWCLALTLLNRTPGCYFHDHCPAPKPSPYTPGRVHGHCPAPDKDPHPRLRLDFRWSLHQMLGPHLVDPWSLPLMLGPTLLNQQAGLPWSLPCTWCLTLTLLNRTPEASMVTALHLMLGPHLTEPHPRLMDLALPCTCLALTLLNRAPEGWTSMVTALHLTWPSLKRYFHGHCLTWCLALTLWTAPQVTDFLTAYTWCLALTLLNRAPGWLPFTALNAWPSPYTHPRLRLDFHSLPCMLGPHLTEPHPWLPAHLMLGPDWTAPQLGLPWSLPCTWCLALTLLNRAPG